MLRFATAPTIPHMANLTSKIFNEYYRRAITVK
jgi:hypothetical protein